VSEHYNVGFCFDCVKPKSLNGLIVHVGVQVT